MGLEVFVGLKEVRRLLSFYSFFLFASLVLAGCGGLSQSAPEGKFSNPVKVAIKLPPGVSMLSGGRMQSTTPRIAAATITAITLEVTGEEMEPLRADVLIPPAGSAVAEVVVDIPFGKSRLFKVTVTTSTGAVFKGEATTDISVSEIKKNPITGELAIPVTIDVKIDIDAPVTIASPAGGIYNSAQLVTLTANEAGTIYYTADGTAPTTASSIFSSAIGISAATTLKFFAVDGAGNSETVKTETYTFDTTAPTVTFKSPTDGVTSVPVNATISATFSEAMDTSTITTATFTVNNGVTGTITFSGGNTIATFTPAASLTNNTTYTVSLTTGIKDPATNRIAATGWSFTTALAAPTGVAVTGGNAQNTISWNGVSKVTSYNLYWSTSSGVTVSTGAQITGVSSPYTHTGLINGTAYYYVVTAVKAGEESAASSEVLGIPVRKVPDTGQTTSYTATFGEDNDYTINPPSYADNGDGTVTDNVTGLMWEKCSEGQTSADCSGGAPATYNWYEATGTADAAYNPNGATNVCGNLSLAGHTDWRLPAPGELQSIANYGTYNPTIKTAYFPNTVPSSYWSSTAYAGSTSFAWYDGFYLGYVYFYAKTAGFHARCVRGGQSSQSFTDNGDGTVTDNVTTLIWQQYNDNALTMLEAITYCEGLSLASHADWRLPNVNELQSLADYSVYNPAINAAYFPGTHLVPYWSSTTYASRPSDAWGVNFSNGNVNYDDKASLYNARCVRGGQ